jgi:hypothetical protein
MAGVGLVAQPNFFVWGKLRSNVLDEPFLYRKVSAPVKKTVLGEKFIIALTESGRVMSWGKAENGCLGLGENKRDLKRDLPGAVPIFAKDSEEEVVDIQMGKEHVVALTKDGVVYTWGSGARGQTGIGEYNTLFKPMPVTRGPMVNKQIKQIAAVGDSTFALATTGEVYAWGDNKDNILGIDDKGSHTDHVAEPTCLTMLSKESCRVRRLEVYENQTIIAHVRHSGDDDDDLMDGDEDEHSAVLTEQVDVEKVRDVTKRVMGRLQEWYNHVLRVKHGATYEGRSDAMADDYKVSLEKLEQAERHLGAMAGEAIAELGSTKKQPGLANARLMLCIFIEMCKLRKEKVQHLLGTRQLSDTVKMAEGIKAHYLTDFGADANEEVKKIVAVTKQLEYVLSVVSRIPVSDGPTRDLKVVLRESIECKLQLHWTRVEMLKAADSKGFRDDPCDAMRPALRILQDRWNHLKEFSLYQMYSDLEATDLKWESDDQYLTHLVQESNKQIDQILEIDNNKLISRDTGVPSLCYDLLRENAKIRKMANSYQLHVLLLYKGREPSGAYVGIDCHHGKHVGHNPRRSAQGGA